MYWNWSSKPLHVRKMSELTKRKINIWHMQPRDAHVHHGARICIRIRWVCLCVYATMGRYSVYATSQIPRLKWRFECSLVYLDQFCSCLLDSFHHSEAEVFKSKHLLFIHSCKFLWCYLVRQHLNTSHRVEKQILKMVAGIITVQPTSIRLVVAAFFGFSFFQSTFLPLWCFFPITLFPWVHLFVFTHPP